MAHKLCNQFKRNLSPLCCGFKGHITNEVLQIPLPSQDISLVSISPTTHRQILATFALQHWHQGANRAQQKKRDNCSVEGREEEQAESSSVDTSYPLNIFQSKESPRLGPLEILRVLRSISLLEKSFDSHFFVCLAFSHCFLCCILCVFRWKGNRARNRGAEGKEAELVQDQVKSWLKNTDRLCK